MGRSFKILFIMLVGLLVVETTGLTAKDTGFILFKQVASGRETLCIVDNAGEGLRTVASAKAISVFPEKRHLLYLADGKLYEYDVHLNQSKLWAKFSESVIGVSVLPDGPDQALIVGSDEYDLKFYVLDFSDGDLRPVSTPSNFKNRNTRKLTVASPDDSYTAIIRTRNGYNYELSVETGNRSKWELPRNLSVFPESPLWSPDSQKLAFYAMPSDNYEGFYSLYLLDLTKPEIILKKVQDDVFSTYLFSNLHTNGFKPVWSDNGDQLIFSYLPYGLPSESSIISYNTRTGAKEILHNNLSQNLYPQLSADGEQLLFLSDREGNQFQLFLTNLKLKDIKRIAPAEGYTAWAEWYQPKN